jgi:hypothetical protein
MKRLRRSRRNIVLAAVVTSPVWLPLQILLRVAEAVVFVADWLADFFADCVARFFETNDDIKARHREQLREQAGTWQRPGKAWICACPGIWGPGAADCSSCGTKRPPHPCPRCSALCDCAYVIVEVERGRYTPTCDHLCAAPAGAA